MTYVNKRWALVCFCHLIMGLGSDGAITIASSSRAVLVGTQGVVIYCTSDGYQVINWAYYPVGGSSLVDIASGSTVYDTQSQYYAVEISGSKQSNLTILNATMTRAGTYNCFQGLTQLASAQLIVIDSDPVCSMIPNAPTELLYNQTVQMNCRFSYTANTSYVTVDMSWSKGSPATNVTSSPPQISTNANPTTAISTISQTPGNFTPFPIYSCKTSFRITGNTPAMNPPDYVKSTPLFNSPINVLYLKPADESSVIGATMGGSVYLGASVTCNVEANPSPNYSWLDVTNGNTTNSSSILIWHSGEYQCTAWNRAASTSVSINVTTYITTTTSTTTTTTTPTTTVTSRSSGVSGSSGTDTTAPTPGSSTGGLSERDKIIIGVVVGVGGALVIAAVTILICCLKKKNKSDKYVNEGTLGKPPPYDDGHQGPQRSANPDVVHGYQLADYPPQQQQQFSPYNNRQNRPYIDDDGLNYAQIQLDNNPRSRQPLQVPEESNYTDVRLA